MEEIIEEFFDRSFEDIITEDMFERDYVFPQSKVEDYVMSLVTTPYQHFIDYICTHYNPSPIGNADIPQISNYEASTTGVCQVMKFRDNPGMDCSEIGASLFSDDIERTEGALMKFGENQVKGAAFHGLTHCCYKKWFLTCLGYNYPDLDEELRQFLSARTLLRNPFFHLIIAEAKEQDVNIKKYMNGLSASTQVRRSSSCMHFFDVITKQCIIENVSLHSIYFSKTETAIFNNLEIDIKDDNIRNDAERQRSKTNSFYVLFPNGKRIQRKNANATLISTLQYIGLEKVATFKEKMFCGFPLVGKRKRDGKYKWQKEVDGWYIYVYITNDTKIQLLKAISDHFGLGLKIVYEATAVNEVPAVNEDLSMYTKHKIKDELNYEELSINRLCAIFFNTSTTYKYFWFISILQLCYKQNVTQIDVDSILIRMIANAWFPIIGYNLSFGQTDSLPKIITALQSELRIPYNSKVDDIVDVITQRKGEDFIRKPLIKLSINVPYCFLSPWIDASYYSDVITRSQKHENGCLYSIYKDLNDFYIVLDAKWKDYLKDHYKSLITFTYEQLACYLKDKNRKYQDIDLLLKSNTEYTATVSEDNIIQQTTLYILQKRYMCYIFNSNYRLIYSTSERIVELKHKMFGVYCSIYNLTIYILSQNNKEESINRQLIIKAKSSTPLFALFENKKYLSQQIEDIIQSDGRYEIKVLGSWYDHNGNIIKKEPIRIKEDSEKDGVIVLSGIVSSKHPNVEMVRSDNNIHEQRSIALVETPLTINESHYIITKTKLRITISSLVQQGDGQLNTAKPLIDAQTWTKLFQVLSNTNNNVLIQDICKDAVTGKYHIKVNDIWYNYFGYPMKPRLSDETVLNERLSTQDTDLTNQENTIFTQNDTSKSYDPHGENGHEYYFGKAKLGQTIKLISTGAIGTIINISTWNNRDGRRTLKIKLENGSLLEIEDSIPVLKIGERKPECQIRVRGLWYNYWGYPKVPAQKDVTAKDHNLPSYGYTSFVNEYMPVTTKSAPNKMKSKNSRASTPSNVVIEPIPKKRRWTLNEEAKLIKFYEVGMSLRTIARILKRDITDVKEKLIKKGKIF